MPSPLIERYETEILGMLQRGMPQAQIIKEFKSRGVALPSSSLSDFARAAQAADAATAVGGNGETGAWFDATLRFQRAMATELTERMADVIEGLQQLKREGDERFAAVQAALNRPQPAREDAGMLPARVEEAIQRLDALAARTAGAGLRWVWFKAFLWASFLWALVLLGMLAYLGGAF